VGASRDDIPVTSDIVITTYDIVRIDIEKFEKLMFDVIVFDEAQMIKNITAKRTSAVRRLNSVFKLTLTGTPLENNIREFYSIMDLTLPGLLVDYEEFASWDDDYQLSYIVERTRPFILRRKKEVILHELPEKTEHDIYLPMNQQQKILYQKVVNEIKDTIANAYQEKTGAQATIIALTALLRLRQICVSPELIVPTYKEPAPKLEYLREKIVELSANKQAALVFSQFTSCLDIIEEHLKKEKISYLRIDGTVPVAKRKAIIEAFQDEKSAITVLLLSLKTGGVGLNLTRANYVFHVDPWWNPAVENQASDRAYRLGQKQHVFVTRLLMNHSIEEKLMHLKKEKADLFAAVLENSQVKRTTPLSKKDFDFLLT
jgi:non-specific serine/threonine protein kinase